MEASERIGGERDCGDETNGLDWCAEEDYVRDHQKDGEDDGDELVGLGLGTTNDKRN